MNSTVPMLVEAIEARLELASFVDDEADLAEGGCCSGSCCIVGGNCTPTVPPQPA